MIEMITKCWQLTCQFLTSWLCSFDLDIVIFDVLSVYIRSQLKHQLSVSVVNQSLSGHVEEVLLFNKFLDCRYMR